jgi:mono/diheme cytochrome c family protein
MIGRPCNLSLFGFAVLCCGVASAEAPAVGSVTSNSAVATAISSDQEAAAGYRVLRTARFLPPDFDDAVFGELWTTWPEPERSQAETASPTERRRLTFEYYGLHPDPDSADPYSQPALGYVSDGKGGWVMSCLACHAGQVDGRVIPGMGNSHYALQTLTEDVRGVKLRMGRPLGHMELGSVRVPLGETIGTTNAVVFGIVLGALRRPDMSVNLAGRPPHLVHHDVDAPPYWNVKYKTSLYIDGFSPKTARPIIQFMMLPQNDRETVYSWEPQFEQILAWINSVESPRYTGPVDSELAGTGRVVFNEHCARCHGTYGPGGVYSQQTIPWDEIQTDRVRLDALTREHRQWMADGWMSRYGQDPVVVDAVGYVPPPLHGVWASAPYFHNGAVPTLWHVLHPEARPVVWKRSHSGYDHARVGLEVEELPTVPQDQQRPAQRRRYFDTRRPGKSSAGHDFPAALSEPEKAAVLEYLKTL